MMPDCYGDGCFGFRLQARATEYDTAAQLLCGPVGNDLILPRDSVHVATHKVAVSYTVTYS